MNITLSNGEKLIQDGKGSYYTSAITAATGTAYLTSQRFIFNKVSMAKMGLFGAFATFTEGNVPVFDIPLTDILNIKRKKLPLVTKYTFVTKDGKEYSVAFACGHEQWITLILDTIKQYTSNTVTEDNEPIIIEANLTMSGMDVIETICGPLFGQYTEKVLEEVFLQKHKKKISMDISQYV